MTTKYHSMIENFKKAFPVILTFLFLFAQSAQAASGVDPAFNPSITKDMTSNFSGNFTLQPDGKIIIFGTFEAGGTYLKRLNTDGSPDNSFDGSITATMNVFSALALPSGKIMIAGFTDIPKLLRLNGNGSIDASYTAVFPSGSLASVWELEILAAQPDGKLIVRRRSAWMGYDLQEVFRLNADGTNDDGFTRLGYGPLRFSHAGYSKIMALPDGKILVARTLFGGTGSTGYINRHNSDGTIDNTFEVPSFGDQFTFPSSIAGFDVYPDGSIIVTGSFASVNSIPKADVVRLHPGGNVDLNFFPDTLFEQFGISAGKVAILPGGQFLVNTAVSGGSNRLYRFNSNGSLDSTYNPPLSLTSVYNWILDGSSRVLGFGEISGVLKYWRLNTDATLDSGFNGPTLFRQGTVSASAVQSDGKILIAGDFNRIGGTLTNIFARVNPDGTLDTSFNNGGSGFDVAPLVFVLQPDGKILAAGDFTSYNGFPVTRLTRLNADGTLDGTFMPDISGVNSIAPLANGQIIVGGSFGTVNGISQSGVARLNANGSLDTSFSPIFGSASISSVFIQPDGKIMAGGSFSNVNGFNRQNLVRLNSDGTLDAGFNAGSIATVMTVIRQADGKYLISHSAFVSRRNSDGTADGTFQSPTVNGTIRAMVLQTDGTFVLGGQFTAGGGQYNIARFSPGGAFDSTFLPAGANNTVNTIARQPDGNLVVGGTFSNIGNAARTGLARINISVIQPRTSFDYDGDGKADVSVFRPSENKWYILRSSDLSVMQFVFAIAGDIPVPADYDGDGRTDFAIFRPSSGDWWSLSSQTGTQVYAHWGASGDIPRPSDFDGDGRTDYVVYRPSNNFWYRISSGNGANSNAAFGAAGDKPVIGDFDGDGKGDKAIFRPSTGDWWYQSSVNGAQLAVHWGISTDIPAPADFDGDGKTDFAVYRPSTGTWYIINSSNFSFTIMNFGISEDKPVPADYDGDGKADIAVFRPSTGAWYLQQSSGGFWGLSFGISTDIPTENAYVQ